MVQIVKEYDEAAADSRTVVVDSPQHTLQHALLDIPYSDSVYFTIPLDFTAP